MSNKVKVPGGAFYAGDGLTVDPITRTVSAGGGDVTTPDWNQNDATASDYVKNRPFYTGDPVETVLVEESTVEFVLEAELYVSRFPSTFEATVGETYKVYWDGTAYECTCISFSDTITIGNLSIIAGAGSDTGEPFIMGIFNNEEIVIFTADTSASHTFSISGTVAPVVKIDKKYLVQPDWNQNDETAADYVKNRPFYSETGNVTVKNVKGQGVLERFPIFAVGDTVTVNVDGVEYSLVAYEDVGNPVIGDTYSSINSGEGQLGWTIYIDGYDVWFYSREPHTFSYLGIDYHHKIDKKYLPDNPLNITSATVGQIAKITAVDNTGKPTAWKAEYLPTAFKPAGKSYLTFRSPSSFTLAVADSTKHWDGTLEYFASDKTWTTWDGTSALSAVADDGEYVLYLRGTGNTAITGDRLLCRWILTGADIACIGNIENLLDYATVESGGHPTLAKSCYQYMFINCTSLTQAPAMPATTLAEGCYNNMFSGCTSLTQAPALPATTLATNCYSSMFYNCTSLAQAPALPATTLAEGCYNNMFGGCTSLKLSSTKTDEYIQEYRIPSSGDGVTATNALKSMFSSTGGTFTGTPSINTTYYLSSNNMIVRETDIATLNGYVGSMIDAAIDKYECIIPSSTPDSTKKFKITVDDSGTISATEVTV